ncbi:hypothetical protein KC644_02490 [Candidatus Berkelbacteria bacterium]|nr:hypothetical protein [Candidatus Berkelbacteria bacterium]
MFKKMVFGLLFLAMAGVASAEDCGGTAGQLFEVADRVIGERQIVAYGQDDRLMVLRRVAAGDLLVVMSVGESPSDVQARLDNDQRGLFVARVLNSGGRFGVRRDSLTGPLVAEQEIKNLLDNLRYVSNGEEYVVTTPPLTVEELKIKKEEDCDDDLVTSGCGQKPRSSYPPNYWREYYRK